MVYPFEDKGDGDWMAREFFSGGIMPSHKLLLYFQDHLKIDKVWHFSGEHYSKTSWAWLNKMDKNKSKIIEIFSGKDNEFSEAVCLNTAAALIVAQKFDNFEESYKFSKAHILSGKGLVHLKKLQIS